MAFYEIREYVVREGKMASWLKMFDEEILPFQVARGMVVAGIFSGEEDDTVFFRIRRFDDEAHREALYKAVYEDPIWKDDIGPRVGEHIIREKIKCSRVVPSAMSILR